MPEVTNPAPDGSASEHDSILLNVLGLKTYFDTPRGVSKAVNGVTFAVRKGETVAIVGESGCGKSATAMSVLRLIDSSAGRIAGGRIDFLGRDLTKLSISDLRKVRGKEISMIFQEPMTSLNPVYTIGNQIGEVIHEHQNVRHSEVRKQIVELLRLVGIPAPETRIDDYPHQLSGGMRQRVMIAMALACKPKLLIADEPTTALDVTIQAQVMDLINRLKDELKTSVILITHDLGLVAEFAQRIVVMYAGKVVEEGDTVSTFERPLHPYTKGLLQSIPKLDRDYEPGERLPEITGMVPQATDLPLGCAFHPRCPAAHARCVAEEPPSIVVSGGRKVSCWLHAPTND